MGGGGLGGGGGGCSPYIGILGKIVVLFLEAEIVMVFFSNARDRYIRRMSRIILKNGILRLIFTQKIAIWPFLEN